MLREILLSVVTVAWSANSEAQPIPNPAHFCLESICGPAEVVQPYSAQLETPRKEMDAFFADGNTLTQIEYPREVQAIVSDIINLMHELKLFDTLETETRIKLKAAYYYESGVLEEDLKGCRLYYAWDQRTLPDADQIEHAQRELPDTVKAMKVDMDHLFGQKRFISVLEETSIDLPPSKS